MFDIRPYLVLIPGLPLLGAIVTAFLGPRLLRRHSHWPCILGSLGAFVFALLTFCSVALGDRQPVQQPYYDWILAGDVHIDFGLQADGLTAIMLLVITFIGSLIAIYSVGYMHGDEGYARFFAEIALFIFSMTGLVLANNFLVLYGFWEGVGLCSYLLIGFWFTKPEAAAAARKAFLVTRLGDVGFFIGILMIFAGMNHTLDYQAVFHQASRLDSGFVTAVCLLLFCGAVGKSAQFPLHVWLPDAMEGPTPVSALIHAATMVTAGVYLVARATPLFVQAPAAQLVVGCIGGFTALLAALIALTQNDLKRVLAYSTISQLGYMFLALGSATLTADGSSALVAVAVVAGIFHLFTHAFFKALLFLAAGSVMHAMGGVIDMRRIGGLRYMLRTTHWTFLCGALALAAFPLTAGFWSKDQILGATWGASIAGHPYGPVFRILFLVALVTAVLTAFYIFRAYFLTFYGELRVPHEAGHHAQESPPIMTFPLVILAAGAILVGYVNAEPFNLNGLSDFLEEHMVGLQRPEAPVVQSYAALLIGIVGLVAALGGMGLAGWMYWLRPGVSSRLAAAIQPLYQLSLNKFYVDELYRFFIVGPLLGLAEVDRVFDLYIVDGIVDLVGHVPRFFGQVFRPIQNGLTQFYALAMALGLTVFLVALIWHYGW
jgi:proton-translocating NADH-quinone oxidoreductase chain L